MTSNPIQTESTQASQPAQGWKSYYYDLTRTGHIPNANSVSIDENNAIFYASYLDLVEVQQKISDSPHSPAITTIYTDVLNIKDVVFKKVALCRLRFCHHGARSSASIGN